jgi:hypothetical protein
VTRDAPNSLGPVQAFLVFGLVVALAGTGLALLRASYSSIAWAFAAVFCGLLSATLDLPAVPAMAAREMGLYTLLALITGAFAIRWDDRLRRPV